MKLLFLRPTCMPVKIGTALFSILLFASSVSAQLKLNVKELPTGEGYGVYLRPCNGIMPSTNTLAGTGQVTLKLPNGNQIAVTGYHGGTWVQNSVIVGPTEAPVFSYYSFGLAGDSPKIVLMGGEETLLFTFTVSSSGVPALIDNDNDPFAVEDNSANSNPGNEISILDTGVTPLGQYIYSGNYSDDDPNSCSSEPEVTPVFEYNDEQTYFTLSPNPASQWLNVGFKNTTAAGQIQLWSLDGKLVYETTAENGNDLRLEIGHLAEGMYFMGLMSDGEVLQREKVLKQ